MTERSPTWQSMLLSGLPFNRYSCTGSIVLDSNALSDMTDAYYTPPELVISLLRGLENHRVERVADFAVGDGRLLQASTQLWPSATALGTDIDVGAIRVLKDAHPNWLLGRCDFLNPRSVTSSPVLRRASAGIDLVVLNPPFSIRGAAYVTVQVHAREFRCSPAMAFLLNSLPFLSRTGILSAVLPQGAFHSERDSTAIAFLRRMFSVQVVGVHDKGTFAGSSASTQVVRLNPAPNGNLNSKSNRLHANLGDYEEISVEIHRGRTPMHTLTSGDQDPLPLIHTTDLKDHTASPNGHNAAGGTIISGPAVLLPRVGALTPGKVALLEGTGRSFVLSDCVIALTSDSLWAAREVQRRLVEDLDVLSQAYGGTGAPYTTLNHLRRALSTMGISERSIEG